MQRESWITHQQEMVGYCAHARILKSRWARGFPSAQVDIRFNGSISSPPDLVIISVRSPSADSPLSHERALLPYPRLSTHLTCRTQPDVASRPFALLGPDERVCAVSAPARQSGVCREMPARQAQMRCPDILLSPLDAKTSREEQDAFLGMATHWQLPVEAQGWGSRLC